MPPFFGSRVTFRVRTFTPPPQLWLHSESSDHVPTSQSTGQSMPVPEHTRISAREPHAAPPKLGGVIIARVQKRVPLPQVREHGVHSPHGWAPHGDIRQSTGHSSASPAHLRTVFSAPHEAPS